ncbi:MAG TPA: PQQ-dependent sugar dehydrogenase, partial [Candidatus Saccharimonadales bacterium]|nr:PQQ-dependent sugar dehydrogenase [Candidatus Saccharimonadales bacterium]
MQKVVLLLFTFILLAFSLIHAPKAFALSAGFKKTLVASGFDQPTTFTQTPDGRILVLEKTGAIKVIKNGSVLSAPMLKLPVDTTGERGLLGIALDPSFASNNLFYIYYVNQTPLEIRVSRFHANADTADPASEQILLRSTQTLNNFHMAGTLRFGPDGKLWISVGNNSINSNSQDLSNIHGKILRINKDGTIPSDNPFFGVAGTKGEIWAYGFRNPFRFNFLPDGRPIVGDVGENATEEVDIIEKGGNYGWPFVEGPCTNCPYINPVFSYNHTSSQSGAVIGGFVYNATATTANAFPSSFNNTYFYGDYVRGIIRQVKLDNEGDYISDQDFDPSAGIIADLQQGADGSLYFINIFPGELYKVTYTSQNLPPTAKITATPQGGLSPLSVSFSSNGSSDPQNLPLSYNWDFGDGLSSIEQNPTHIYQTNGTFTATLTVSNGAQTSSPVSKTIIVGDAPPQASITSPTADQKYNAGDVISYSGSATDLEDGNLPASAYSWTIIFHHNTHIHPFLGPITGKNGTFTIPNTGEASADTWYEIDLTVTDSRGLTDTKTIAIHPNVINLTFTSAPSGLSFTLDGIPHTTPYTTPSVVGFLHTLDTPTPQTLSGTSYAFASWSDSGAKSHQITTPAVDTSYQANFTSAGAGAGTLHFRIRQFSPDGSATGFINGATVKVTDPTGQTVFATATSAKFGSDDGWANFDNIQAGTYGILAYKQGFTGFWHQTTCAGSGTTTNATIKNSITESQIAAFKQDVTISPNQITWCQDLGLKSAGAGNLFFRVQLMGRNSQSTAAGYVPMGGVNDATVKLLDATGSAVLQTTTSAPSGSADGWVFFTGVPAGNYSILAYKSGFVGFWKQTDCSGTQSINATVQNANTEGNQAAYNNQVTIVGGATTYCMDLGLKGFGSVKFRVREFDTNGVFTGNFINGATAKLTDGAGNTVYATTTSQQVNGQDGWVIFNNVESSIYTGAMAYKTGLAGFWKQTDCNGTGVTDSATITNANTASQTAGWQSSDNVSPGQITWCKDIGLQNGGVQNQRGS